MPILLVAYDSHFSIEDRQIATQLTNYAGQHNLNASEDALIVYAANHLKGII